MTTFTITITPDNKDLATTSIRVEATASTVLITELLITAAAGTGLMATQLPAVNLDLLLQAVTPAVLTTPATAPAQTPALADVAAPAAVAEKATRPRDVRKPAAPVTVSEPAAPVVKPRKRAASTTKPLDATPKPTKPKTRAATVDKGSAGPEAAETSGRTYRKMPADLPEVFAQAGSVIGVADHYQVPRHTAQNWIGRARKQGTIPTR